MRREGVSTPTAPIKMVPSNQVLFLKIGFKWFLILIFKINHFENFYSFLLSFLNLVNLCGKKHEIFYRSIVLNILNTIKNV